MQTKRVNILFSLLIVSSFVSAAPNDDRFNLEGIYLFNVVSRASTTDMEFNESNGYALFGGYRFSKHFSVELGSISFEPIKTLESTLDRNILTEYDTTGFTLGVRGEAPVGDLFQVWVGVGLFSWDSVFNYEVEYPNFPTISRSGSNTNSEKDFYLRLGITHPISSSFDITLETMQMKFSDFFSNTDQNNTDFRQDYIGIGVGYRF